MKGLKSFAVNLAENVKTANGMFSTDWRALVHYHQHTATVPERGLDQRQVEFAKQISSQPIPLPFSRVSKGREVLSACVCVSEPQNAGFVALFESDGPLVFLPPATYNTHVQGKSW